MGQFFEIILNADDFSKAGIEGRDEIQDPIDQVLNDAGIGEISGGGAGLGNVVLDVEIWNENDLDKAIRLVIEQLKQLNVPMGSRIRVSKPTEKIFRVYDGCSGPVS